MARPEWLCCAKPTLSNTGGLTSVRMIPEMKCRVQCSQWMMYVDGNKSDDHYFGLDSQNAHPMRPVEPASTASRPSLMVTTQQPGMRNGAPGRSTWHLVHTKSLAARQEAPKASLETFAWFETFFSPQVDWKDSIYLWVFRKDCRHVETLHLCLNQPDMWRWNPECSRPGATSTAATCKS